MEMETEDIDEVADDKTVEEPSTDDTNKVNGTEQRIVKPDERHLVQIKASNSEITRRINAFIEKKQIEVDQNNRQEFCNVHPSMEDDEESCARCRAVFIPRGDGKSHIKVSRVVNMYGPQTQVLASNRTTSPQKPYIKQEPLSSNGMEERLANMEAHLNLKAISKVDIYKRLKNLEERILFLESLSPEYFSSGPPGLKKRRQSSRSTVNDDSDSKDLTIGEIDARIASLRESLLKRSLPATY